MRWTGVDSARMARHAPTPPPRAPARRCRAADRGTVRQAYARVAQLPDAIEGCCSAAKAALRTAPRHGNPFGKPAHLHCAESLCCIGSATGAVAPPSAPARIHLGEFTSVALAVPTPSAAPASIIAAGPRAARRPSPDQRHDRRGGLRPPRRSAGSSVMGGRRQRFHIRSRAADVPRPELTVAAACVGRTELPPMASERPFTMSYLASRFISGCIALALASTAFAADVQLKSLDIRQPFARATPPGAKSTAVFMTIENKGKDADRLPPPPRRPQASSRSTR